MQKNSIDKCRKLNILIICSFFPPDTSIAAIRPFMFAKHLLKKGHRVTVLRSGKFSLMPDSSFEGYPEGLRIINALGNDCPAARYEKGKEEYRPSRKMGWLHPELRETLRMIWCRYGVEMIDLKRLREAKRIFEKQKECINKLSRDFDLIFATYGDLENIYAGMYASKRLKCEWIMDLRDVITSPYREILWNIKVRRIEKKAAKDCSACITISDGLSRRIYQKTGKKAVTIYNGYDEEKTRAADKTDKEKSKGSLHPNQLVFCYTGAIYKERITAFHWFCSQLRSLVKKGDIRTNQLRFIYAGGYADFVRKGLKKYGLETILDDRGYLSRMEVYDIQNESDLFLLLSSNTKKLRGVMTGKFYEGIRSRRPILCIITGDVPGSELAEINHKYQYGYCCECMSENAVPEFRNYITKALKDKLCTGQVNYMPGDGLFERFQYSTLTNELEKVMYQVLGMSKTK